jgi:hypothetical protein
LILFAEFELSSDFVFRRTVLADSMVQTGADSSDRFVQGARGYEKACVGILSLIPIAALWFDILIHPLTTRSWSFWLFRTLALPAVCLTCMFTGVRVNSEISYGLGVLFSLSILTYFILLLAPSWLILRRFERLSAQRTKGGMTVYIFAALQVLFLAGHIVARVRLDP